MEKSCEKFLSLIFCMFCMLLTLFLCSLQLMKYFENNDSSSFKYREFLASPQDQYPLFTFCYEKSEKQMNGPNLLSTDYLDKRKLNRTKLQNSLRGKEQTFFLDLYSIDYHEIMPRLNQVIKEYYINTLDCKLTWYSDVNKRQRKEHCNDEKLKEVDPMIKTYQDPQKVCFSRNNEFGPQKVRTHERLMLNWEFLKSVNGTLRIYHHNKQQSLRRICKYIISKETSTVKAGKLEFWVSEVTFLRKRIDGKEPCDPNIKDDEEALKVIMKKFNCTPPYWKFMVPKGIQYPDCTSPKQLENIYNVIKEPAQMVRVFKKYTEPCDKMSSTVTFHWRSAKVLNESEEIFDLEFNYLEDTYQEVLSQKDFGMEMLASSIGGYIGMFLGYSLLQCPQILSSVSTLIKKLKLM